MSLADKIRKLWNIKYWDAKACGYSDKQSEEVANNATARLRSDLKRIEQAQKQRTPRHTNLAGLRQHKLRQAGY